MQITFLGGVGTVTGSKYLLASGVDRVVTCNTIAHPSNGIDVTELLAGGIRSVSDFS